MVAEESSGEAPNSGRSGVVASALVATLEQAWDAIGRHHPEVPSVIVVVAPGSGSRAGELKLGHFSATRWKVADGERSELLVGGEGLQLGALEVLGTLLHEAAHGVAWVREVQDTSRGGRYHNRRFKALAEEIASKSPKPAAWVGRRRKSGTRRGPAMARCWPRSKPLWCCGGGPTATRAARAPAGGTPWCAAVAVAEASRSPMTPRPAPVERRENDGGGVGKLTVRPAPTDGVPREG